MSRFLMVYKVLQSVIGNIYPFVYKILSSYVCDHEYIKLHINCYETQCLASVKWLEYFWKQLPSTANIDNRLNGYQCNW